MLMLDKGQYTQVIPKGLRFFLAEYALFVKLLKLRGIEAEKKVGDSFFGRPILHFHSILNRQVFKKL
jgi:hypothetical protein